MEKKERENKLRKQIILYGRQNKRLKKMESEIALLKQELTDIIKSLEDKVKTTRDNEG